MNEQYEQAKADLMEANLTAVYAALAAPVRPELERLLKNPAAELAALEERQAAATVLDAQLALMVRVSVNTHDRVKPDWTRPTPGMFAAITVPGEITDADNELEDEEEQEESTEERAERIRWERADEDFDR